MARKYRLESQETLHPRRIVSNKYIQFEGSFQILLSKTPIILAASPCIVCLMYEHKYYFNCVKGRDIIIYTFSYNLIILYSIIFNYLCMRSLDKRILHFYQFITIAKNELSSEYRVFYCARGSAVKAIINKAGLFEISTN